MATAQLTTDNDAILAEIFIAAPPARVFEAITDPGQRLKWWGMKGLFRVADSQSDLRLGGKWFDVGVTDDGRPFRVEGWAKVPRLDASLYRKRRNHRHEMKAFHPENSL